MKVSQYGTFQVLWTFLQVQSQKPSSAMMKLALMRTARGNEDPELHLLQRISSVELPASEIAAQINDSQSSSNRHISTSRLRESGLHGRITAKKPKLKDSNNKKRLAWAKKHKQWTLDWWKSVLWPDESKFEIIGSNRCDIHMCGSHHEAWRIRCDGVGMLCWWHCHWFI